MNSIIALWTHPRSISTAFERVMMERGDLKIFHEPFSYYYFIHEGKGSISHEYEDPDHPISYRDIRNYIISAGEEVSIFFKDMCYYCNDRLKEDDEFLTRLVNTFLIRNPAKSIASYYAKYPALTLEEVGCEQLFQIFEHVVDLTGNRPIVIDADDLENNPDGIVKAYCDAIGIKFIPESLHWKAEEKKEWDIWKTWHEDALQSTGIQKNMEKLEITIDNNDLLKSYYGHQIRYYEAMYKHRIGL